MPQLILTFRNDQILNLGQAFRSDRSNPRINELVHCGGIGSNNGNTMGQSSNGRSVSPSNILGKRALVIFRGCRVRMLTGGLKQNDGRDVILAHSVPDFVNQRVRCLVTERLGD